MTTSARAPGCGAVLSQIRRSLDVRIQRVMIRPLIRYIARYTSVLKHRLSFCFVVDADAQSLRKRRAKRQSVLSLSVTVAQSCRQTRLADTFKRRFLEPRGF